MIETIEMYLNIIIKNVDYNSNSTTERLKLLMKYIYQIFDP